MRFLTLALVLVLSLAAPFSVLAVQPGEMLADPVLEARAREISRNVRCLVCRNESIDDSNADLAHDLRVLVRERLTAGDTDAQVFDYLVDRYGEYVLLKPRLTAQNAILWFGGPGMLIIGGAIAVLFLRRRAAAGDGAQVRPAPLSEDERARLDELLKG